MTKKRKRTELDALCESEAGSGISTDPEDYPLAISDDEARSPELRAVFKADITGSPQPIIDHLQSYGLRWIADYLARHQIKRKQGRARTPAYALSPADVNLKFGIDEVDSLMKVEGLSRDAAIGKFAKQMFPRDEAAASVLVESLRNYVRGQRGSTERQRRRRTALKG
jgi:hypothetical protein